MDIQKIKESTKFFIKENANLLVFFIVVFAFLLRISFLLYSPIRGWDETDYLNLGLQLSKHPFDYSLLNSGWNDFIVSNDVVYGWPNTGFRAPLLPYMLSLIYFLKLNFLIDLIIPIFGALSVYLTYLLGSKLFNKEIGIFSAIYLSLTPLHILFSGQILTDTFVVFFVLLTFISFWEGYENNKNKHKVMFGLFLALSLLARYTTLWIAPIFLIYFLIRDKSIKFLKDKYLWYSIGVFFLTLTPWFIYGYKYYGNILGAFIHGFMAASYWGGVQSWNFFIINSWEIFSVISIIFLFSIFYIVYKKEYKKRQIYLLFVWIIFFSGMAMYMPHKEERFIMPVVPAITIISAFFVSKLGKFKNTFLILSVLILLITFRVDLKVENEVKDNKANICFKEANIFLASSIEKDSLVVTNQSPVVFYYTKIENVFYPKPWSLEGLDKLLSIKKNKNTYLLYTNYEVYDNKNLKNDLDKRFKKVFECSKDWGYSAIYLY